jgi:nicotinate phosphoribosyltransferase
MQSDNSTTNKTMLTDLYQLTMNAAYMDNGKDEMATFDLFIRKLPQDWGYYLVTGIEEAIEYATHIKFQKEDIDYLRTQGIFKDEFLEFLKDFKFEGEIYAVKEGTPIFANEPVLRVTAKRTQAQFLETTLLNIINYQTMIASKASRVVTAANGASVVDYGLRRAQGEDAAVQGARAAYIGGAVGTSNVLAGKKHNIPIKGTHAHSFVMSFEKEIDAFRAYVRTFQDNATLLIDTYDTIQGAKNAATVGKELESTGHTLAAVRLDSGDLVNLSQKVRKILDEEGLNYVKIVASNDLNEYKIAELIQKGAKIDAYGVGTELITAKPVAAIPGVYKLSEDITGGKIKLSADKKSHPGKKQIFRFFDHDGHYSHDVLGLAEENSEGIPLLELVVKDGKRLNPERSLEEIRAYCRDSVQMIPQLFRQLQACNGYEVKASNGLMQLEARLTEKYQQHNGG